MRISFSLLCLILSIQLIWAEDILGQAVKDTDITYVVKSTSLNEVFSQLSKLTGYHFFYDESVLTDIEPVDIQVNNGSIDNVLKELNAQTKLQFKKIDGTISVSKAIPVVEIIKQDKKKITGIITDELGEPIIGANVIEKGTTNGVITDVDGKFTIHVSRSLLVISYIGYVSQEVKVGSNLLANISLKEDVLGLEEVVIVGYSTMKKENLTGAVTQLRGEVLENRSVTTISQALQGTVANLNISSSSGGAPGTNQSINIRGYTGFGLDNSGNMQAKSQSPLIVIDGIQGGDINTINMDDVESISVLKDAASTAIYGSSAPYGVIIINTKKGKRAAKASITYSNNFGFAQPINQPKMMNSLDFANLYNEAAANANMSLIFTDENIQRIKDYQSGKMKDETIANPATGKDEWLTWTGNGNNDWFDLFFKNVSFSQQHNIGVSGGTDKSNYYVGLGYNQKDGLYNYGDDVYKRYNLRVNLSTNLTKWLQFSMRSAYSRSTTDTPNTYSGKTGGNYMHQIARKWPTAPLYNPNGEYSYPSDIRLQEEGGRNEKDVDRVVLTGEFVLTPLEGWDITANYSYTGTYINASEHTKTLYVANPSGSSVVYAGTTPNGFKRINDKNQHHVMNLFSSYEKKVDGHYFKVMGGFTQELYDNLQMSASNSDLYSDGFPSLSLTYGTSPSIEDKASQLAIRGGFGRINYNYQEKYLVEFNGRYDGTSRFLKDVRFKFYPGVSAAWVLSKESFWKPLEEYVNTMKFRVSYGSLGDQGFVDSYYPFYPSLSTKAPAGTNWAFSDGRQAYVSYPSLINPDLSWVTTNTIDFGVDMTFLHHRLNLSFDWYKRTSKDFVGPAEVLPSIIGASSPQKNNSSMETKGFELSIGWKDRINEFNYGASLVLSDYTGKITKYPNPTGLITTWYEGRKIGDIWGYETAGIFLSEEEIAAAPSQSKLHAQWTPGDIRYVDRDGSGEINWGDNTLENPGDKKVIGNNTPRFSFGINLNGDYKGFDFAVFMQGVAKRDAWVGSNIFWGIVGDQWQSSVLTVHKDRWSVDAPNGYFPKYYMTSQNNKNTQTQTRYLQNAAYLRIKNVQLGYTFPKELINKINFNKLRVYVSVENLATFTNMIKTIDPEFSASDGKLYPLQRTWSLGMNVSF